MLCLTNKFCLHLLKKTLFLCIVFPIIGLSLISLAPCGAPAAPVLYILDILERHCPSVAVAASDLQFPRCIHIANRASFELQSNSLSFSEGFVAVVAHPCALLGLLKVQQACAAHFEMHTRLSITIEVIKIMIVNTCLTIFSHSFLFILKLFASFALQSSIIAVIPRIIALGATFSGIILS